MNKTLTEKWVDTTKHLSAGASIGILTFLIITRIVQFEDEMSKYLLLIALVALFDYISVGVKHIYVHILASRIEKAKRMR